MTHENLGEAGRADRITEAQKEAREEFVWNMHTDYSAVAERAFDGGWNAALDSFPVVSPTREEIAVEHVELLLSERAKVRTLLGYRMDISDELRVLILPLVEEPALTPGLTERTETK